MNFHPVGTREADWNCILPPGHIHIGRFLAHSGLGQNVLEGQGNFTCWLLRLQQIASWRCWRYSAFELPVHILSTVHFLLVVVRHVFKTLLIHTVLLYRYVYLVLILYGLYTYLQYTIYLHYLIIFIVSCCIYDICVCMCVCVHYSCMCRSPSACRCSCCSFSASEVFMNYLDVLVTVASFVEVIFFWAFRTEMGVNPMYSSCTILSCMSCNSLQPCDPSHSRDWLSSIETVISVIDQLNDVVRLRPNNVFWSLELWGFSGCYE